MNQAAKVTLLGAGPGSPDLITLRGAKALASADVVLYDALIDTQLLEYAGRAQHIYVGKRANLHAYTQEQINQMMAELAIRYGHVVRLKGGDPFVFGRGYEEIVYLRTRGIATEVIPGLSSAVCLPGLQEIPLTRRGYSEGFWVVTATTHSGDLSQEIYQAVGLRRTTVVILMGFQKLAAIAALYKREGRGGEPVAVIQQGSLPEEKLVLGRMDSIIRQVQEAGLGTPAIIIVGRVVELHKRFEIPENEYIVTVN